MPGILQRLWLRFFPLSELQAVKIAIAECSKTGKVDERKFSASKERPNNYLPKGSSMEVPCWYIFAPWGDALEGAVL